MGHLWLERSLLIVTLLSFLAPGSGGYIETMRKVSVSLLCNDRTILSPTNISSQRNRYPNRTTTVFQVTWYMPVFPIVVSSVFLQDKTRIICKLTPFAFHHHFVSQARENVTCSSTNRAGSSCYRTHNLSSSRRLFQECASHKYKTFQHNQSVFIFLMTTYKSQENASNHRKTNLNHFIHVILLGSPHKRVLPNFGKIDSFLTNIESNRPQITSRIRIRIGYSKPLNSDLYCSLWISFRALEICIMFGKYHFPISITNFRK